MNIDSATIWTLLGVAATITFGAWTLYYAVVGRRYPGRITFVQEDCIGLFDSIVRNFPEIVISYQDNPVGKNLVLLKGAFLNTGTKDIAKQMVAIPLTIILPSGYTWLTARVVAASPEATSAIVPSTDRSKLAFDLGLFRCGEYLRFEALAEVPTSEDAAKDDPAKSLKNALAFEHRIADTRKVDTTEIMLVDSRKKRHLATLAVLALQAVLAAAAVVSAFWSGSPTLEGNLQFWYTPSGSKGVLVSITPRADGKLRLSGVTEKFDQVVPVEAFFYGRTWKPIIAKKYGETVSAVMMAFIFLVTAFLLFIYVRVLIRESRLRDVLSLSPPKKRANAKT